MRRKPHYRNCRRLLRPRRQCLDDDDPFTDDDFDPPPYGCAEIKEGTP